MSTLALTLMLAAVAFVASCARTAPAGRDGRDDPKACAPWMLATLAGSYSAPSPCWRRPANDPQLALTETAWASALQREAACRLRAVSEKQRHKIGATGQR